MPTYQPNIPQASELISVSQNNILENFQQINTAWNIDHSAFNLGSQGQHTKVTLTAPISDPDKGTPIASLYTKAAPTTVLSDLYYQNNSGIANVVQITGGGITTAAYANIIGATGISNVSYNSSTSRISIGKYTVSFTRSFSSTNYLASLSANGTGVTGVNFVAFSYGASAFTFETRDQNGALFDPAEIACIFLGKLA